MRSDISFVAGLTLLFISNVESQAYGKPEPDNHHHFDARQAVAPTSSTPDATAGVAAAVSASNAAQASAVASICDAASNRNQKMWVANNMDIWFENMTIMYILNGWTNPDGSPVENIQYLMLDWAHDGENPCGNLSRDCNPNPEYSQCIQYPEATFLWYATSTFSNYLGNMANMIVTNNGWLSDATGNMVGQFFTPPNKPTTLIAPFSITGGIAAGISSFFPPAAIIAGLAAIANGILTQKGLSEPNPLNQWMDVSSQLKTIAQQTYNFINSYWVAQLGSTPEIANNVTGKSYFQDPTALPGILAPGGFASSTSGDVINTTSIYATLASAGINALWNSDRAFIVKMSDATLGLGAGQACAQYPNMTYCDNGVAYIFIRWVMAETYDGKGSPTISVLDTSNWQVWGAYPSVANNPSGNTNYLEDYGLDLGLIALSSMRVQQAYGFWTTQTAQTTIDAVLADISNLSPDKIISWNMLVCDLDAILGGKHFVYPQDYGWVSLIVCSCANMKDINGKAWPLPYPDNPSYSPSECASKYWTS